MLSNLKRNPVSCLIVALFCLAWLGGCSFSSTELRQPAEELVKAEEDQAAVLEEMNKIADNFYTLVREGDNVEARQQLEKLSDLMTQIRFEGITSIEGVEALSETIIQAKRMFNSISLDSEAAMIAAATIRLTTDALKHPNQPMWLQYYKVLNEDIAAMEHAVKQQRVVEVKRALGQLHQHYSIIRPCLYIQREVYEVEKAESLFTFMETQLKGESIHYANLQTGIAEFRGWIDVLFQKKHAQAYISQADVKQTVLWTTGIGSFIITILSYVAWRKYKADKGYVFVRNERRSDGED